MILDDPNTKGDLGELIVTARLIRDGYCVYKAVNKNARVDLVAQTPAGILRKIQVKTTTSKNGRACLSLRKMCLNPKYNSIYTADEIDVFALYIEDRDIVCFVDAHIALRCKTGMTFRLESSLNGQTKGINLASDFASFPNGSVAQLDSAQPSEG